MDFAQRGCWENNASLLIMIAQPCRIILAPSTS